MPKRPKYHFLIIEMQGQTKYAVTCPGQTYGLNPVPDNCIVRPEGRNKAKAARLIRSLDPGEVLATTTLRKVGSNSRSLAAADLVPVRDNGQLLYSDTEQLYQEYLNQKRQ